MTNEAPRILIGCPTARAKDYCLLQWLLHIQQIQYPKDRLKLMVSDNSRDLDYVRKLRMLGIDEVQHIEPGNRGSIAYLADSHEQVRKYALENDFDYLLHLESDVMIEPFTLLKLLDLEVPVAVAPYYIGAHNYPEKLLHALTRTINSFPERNMSMAHAILFCDGKPRPIYSAGIGCALIHRTVLERIPFRYVANQNLHPDTWFAQDCYFHRDEMYPAGIPIIALTGEVLRHDNQEWQYNPDYYKLN